jgi:hypothetical protein
MKVKDLKKEYAVIKKVKCDDRVFEICIWNGMKRTFNNLEDAKRALERDMKKEKSKNPIVVNGIGIETEKVDSEVEYYIEWRWISKWEEIYRKGVN